MNHTSAPTNARNPSPITTMCASERENSRLAHTGSSGRGAGPSGLAHTGPSDQSLRPLNLRGRCIARSLFAILLLGAHPHGRLSRATRHVKKTASETLAFRQEAGLRRAICFAHRGPRRLAWSGHGSAVPLPSSSHENRGNVPFHLVDWRHISEQTPNGSAPRRVGFGTLFAPQSVARREGKECPGWLPTPTRCPEAPHTECFTFS